MAQFIGCHLEDEEGKLITDSHLNFASIYLILWHVDKEKKKYIWLHTIDQYGDTTFNHLQIPFVKAELEELRSENIAQDIKKLIDDVLNFITSIDTHKYIKFVGD
jgi:hypothetical protein